MKKFQKAVGSWLLKCFGQDIAKDKLERSFRFTEEALELAQATGLTKIQILILVDYVYSRGTGEPTQEIGGVMVTLAALCEANNFDLELAADTELKRIHQKINKIREKHFSKPKDVVSPLPGIVG